MDPLDAFMAAEINPEVAAKERQEVQKREEERLQKAQQRAVSYQELLQASSISRSPFPHWDQLLQKECCCPSAAWFWVHAGGEDTQAGSHSGRQR